MSYKNRVLDWVRNETSRNAEYVPEGFPLDLFYSSLSDKELGSLANSLYAGMKKTKSERESRKHEKNDDNEEVYLVPYRGGNGATYFWDRSKPGYHLKAVIMPMENGMFAYKGERKYITMLGGRSELGGIRTDMEGDMDWYNNKRK